jgi:hypothetical protein
MRRKSVPGAQAPERVLSPGDMWSRAWSAEAKALSRWRNRRAHAASALAQDGVTLPVPARVAPGRAGPVSSLRDKSQRAGRSQREVMKR